MNRRHGRLVYELLQERRKIDHNQAQIDWLFPERTANQNIQHAYKEYDAIQRSHIDVLLAIYALS